MHCEPASSLWRVENRSSGSTLLTDGEAVVLATPPGKPVDSNIYAPFASATDWLVARWAKMQGPGSTAMTDLLKIPLVSAL